MTRYLGLAEFWFLAEQVTGIDSTTLLRASRVDLADSALHAPQAGFEEEDFYPLQDPGASDGGLDQELDAFRVAGPVMGLGNSFADPVLFERVAVTPDPAPHLHDEIDGGLSVAGNAHLFQQIHSIAGDLGSAGVGRVGVRPDHDDGEGGHEFGVGDGCPADDGAHPWRLRRGGRGRRPGHG